MMIMIRRRAVDLFFLAGYAAFLGGCSEYLDRRDTLRRSTGEAVQNNIVTQAQQAYWSQTSFVCNINDGCMMQRGPRVDDSGKNLGEFAYYVFSDGSIIGKETLDRGGQKDGQNTELSRALSKRNIQY